MQTSMKEEPASSEEKPEVREAVSLEQRARKPMTWLSLQLYISDSHPFPGCKKKATAPTFDLLHLCFFSLSLNLALPNIIE